MTNYTGDIDRAISQLAEMVAPDVSPAGLRSLGAALVSKLTPDERSRLATDRLVEAARARSREETQAREEEATRKQFGTRKIRHGSVAQRDGGVTFGCTCGLCTAAAEAEDAHRDRMANAVRQIVDDYTEQLRVEWTDDLLASTFALPDGTVVTWGDATPDQHRARAEQFEHHAVTDMETAALHRKAIAAIEEHHTWCLAELVPAA